MTRLAGPRLLLLEVPPEVAAAVVDGSGERIADTLARHGLVAGPGWPHADTASALLPLLAQPAAGTFLIVDGADVVGECGRTGELDPDGGLAFGYGLAAPARGQGLGTEAVALLCAWLERQPGVRLLVAEVLPGNEPSRRLLARLGFVREGTDPPYDRWVRSRRPRVAGRHVC